MAILLGTGDVTMTLDDGAERFVRSVIDQAIPGATAAIEQELETVYSDAVRRAPVKTGKFKASIQRQIVVAPDYSSIRGRLWSDVEYARFIVSKRTLPGSGSALVELFRKPVNAAADRLIDRLGPIIAERLRRG